eukprot:SAG22_NODE_913_length_6527_cov_2.919726_5_plen_75_part_00
MSTTPPRKRGSRDGGSHTVLVHDSNDIVLVHIFVHTQYLQYGTKFLTRSSSPFEQRAAAARAAAAPAPAVVACS